MTQQIKIQAFPSLDLRKKGRQSSDEDPVLEGQKTQLYASGRAALFHAVKSLNLLPGSVILLPSFNCGVEVEAVLRAGCKVDFFRIKDDLSMDVDDINEKICSSTKAIVVIHYFGFPQDLTELKVVCRRRDIVLLEDCAHALYSQNESGKWLGTEGDIGLFSMRKTFFMPNGGAVRLNRKGFVSPPKGKSFFNLDLLKVTIKSILEKEKTRGGIAADVSSALLALNEKNNSKTDSSEVTGSDESKRWYYDVPSLGYENDISAISILCSGRDYYQEIIARRRKNYLLLKNFLDGHCGHDPVFAELPDGTCPLCLPLFVSQSDEVAAKMMKKGVVPYIFGRHPHPLVNADIFQEVTSLSGTIIGLPIHQQLADKDMENVADVFIHSL